MLYENGLYTEKIHEMNAGQVWQAWKNQCLNVGQVATWQERHNFYFDFEKPFENYNIYVNTENEKYHIIKTARTCGAIITSVSGCGAGYYLTIDATPGQADYINNRIGGPAA